MGKVLIRVGRRLRLTAFFAAVVPLLMAFSLTAAAASDARMVAGGAALLTAGVMLRGLWRTASTLASADRLIARVLLDAGSSPFGPRLGARVGQARRARRRAPDASAPTLEHPAASEASAVVHPRGTPQHAG